ncbi:hypothetical protein SAMN05216188_11883 [Lentzea xinjiangensis]|uniref:DNA-binding phage zinc finger domain-containing protein n=1 Tax=Lentzea xinjiangensis TaxID=402600 RepID=A0A1H9TFB0_9PSEU|nr:hypothetical protein [Lentzea xinjiangensis]SER95786.1 hypothetical protein SAMN05216188_11883 [Lentzea xinjiangensis]
MTRDELAVLMGVASGVDRYFPAADDDVLDAWYELLADIPAAAAREAFRHHYRGTSETITPYDIANYWRARRQQPPVGAGAVRNDAQIQAGVDRALAALVERKALKSGEDLNTAQAIAEGETAVRRLYRSVPCPVCQAEPSRPCVTWKGQPLTKSPAHPARIEAAQAGVRVTSDESSRA